MVYSGQNSYVYWGVEGTALAGDPSSDQNIPFNPCEKFTAPKPEYEETTKRTFDQLEPKYKFTNTLAPKTETNPHMFKDPFLLLACFTNKNVGGSWGTGDGTISADFTNNDDEDTLFIQEHVADQSGSGNHVDRLIKGVLPVSYAWIMEAGKMLMEEVTLKGLDYSDNTQAMSCSNDFHDQAWGDGVGGFADWDTDGKRPVKDMEIELGGAAIDGLQIESGTLKFDLGYDTSQIISSLSHSVKWLGVRDFIFTLKGKLNDKGELEEAEKLYSAKTTSTLKIYYDNETGYEKYLQITNVAVEKHNVVEIPAAGSPVEANITFKGGEDCAASFSGTWEDHADPSVLVTYT